MKVKCSCGRIFDLPDYSEGEFLAKGKTEEMVRHLMANPDHTAQAIPEGEEEP